MRAAVAAAAVLAVLVSVVHVQAYSWAQVSQAVTVTVTTTDMAAIALSPGTGTGNAAGTAYYCTAARDALCLDFRRGFGGASGYGFAPRRTETPPGGQAVQVAGDVYQFRGLFRVTNRGAASRCLSVYATGSVAGLQAIYLRPVGNPGNGTQVAGAGGGRVGCANVLAGDQREVDFWWDFSATSGAEAAYSFTLWVEGQ